MVSLWRSKKTRSSRTRSSTKILWSREWSGTSPIRKVQLGSSSKTRLDGCWPNAASTRGSTQNQMSWNTQLRLINTWRGYHVRSYSLTCVAAAVDTSRFRGVPRRQWVLDTFFLIFRRMDEYCCGLVATMYKNHVSWDSWDWTIVRAVSIDYGHISNFRCLQESSQDRIQLFIFEFKLDVTTEW